MTKDRILEAAERLFAENGFEGTSLRQITAAASTNLASVHYHFGTKDDLMLAVLNRRLTPINQKRLEMLDAIEVHPPPLSAILTAFYAPVVELIEGPGAEFLPLFGRILFEGGRSREFFFQLMQPVASRFLAALRSALPHLQEEELFWRMHFTAAILGFTMAGSHVLAWVSGGKCQLRGARDITERMVEFSAAGLRAPVHQRSSL
jgi:AcrR family transcriptional regulator